MPTADELETQRKQPVYDTTIAKTMALKCQQWALYALGAKTNPFDQDREFEAARAAYVGQEDLALDTYARGYAEAYNHGLETERPTLETLVRWLAAGECPAAEEADTKKRLSALYQAPTQLLPLEIMMRHGGLFPVTVVVAVDLDDPDQRGTHPLSDIFLRWYEAKHKGLDVKHPLAPIMKVWFASRPRLADASNRTKKRIIPAKVAMAPPGDRRAGKLFSVAAHMADGPDSQLVMPGFQHDRQAPALPLALYDLGLGATADQNRISYASLSLRLWITSILLTNQHDRHGNHPVALEIPLRKLLAELYPGPRKPRPTEYWPRLMQAVEDLDSMAARVPWYDPETKRGGLRRVASVSDIPRGKHALDDHVRIVVDLPPGSENGPQVSDNLAMWGTKSGRAYRALLNLAYWWHDPGVTARPLGKRVDGQGDFWGMSASPDNYPEMTAELMVQIVFPTSAKKNFHHLLSDARRVFEQLHKAGEIEIINGKPVPIIKPTQPTSE